MKTWLITGCSSGIGRGIAKAVLKKGDNAVVTARDTSKIADLVDQYPNTALGVALDITKKESISAAVKQAQERFGTIDIDDVNLLFNTNFFGPIELIKEVLPQMRANKNGAIVNVSSIAAVRSGVGSGYYAASKAALELMTDGLAKELKPLGIKVMIAQPGSFRTNFYDTSLKGTKNKIDDYNETAGKTRKENVVNHKNQPGDPDKGGQVIVDTIEKDNYPFRLLLGSDATKIVASALEERIQEIETWKNISSQSDFE